MEAVLYDQLLFKSNVSLCLSFCNNILQVTILYIVLIYIILGVCPEKFPILYFLKYSCSWLSVPDILLLSLQLKYNFSKSFCTFPGNLFVKEHIQNEYSYNLVTHHCHNFIHNSLLSQMPFQLVCVAGCTVVN